MIAPDEPVAGGDSSSIARRAFVAHTSGMLLSVPPLAALLATIASCASLVTRPVTPVDGALHLPLRLYPELTEPDGFLTVVPRTPGEADAEPIHVLALGGRAFVALSPICTHLGCTVEIERAHLVCPCHGSTYDREGRVVQGPAQRALARYRTELTRDDVLVVHLGAPA
jgi:Rieske Fe-S protein